MKSLAWVPVIALASASILTVSILGAEAPKLEWKVSKGDKLAFTVARTSTMDSQSSRGSFKSEGSSEIEYRIEVAEAKGGDLELKVAYGVIKMKQSGREGGAGWEFDSAKKEGDDASAKYLKEVLGKTFTAKVSGGKIADVEGFPEVERPEGGQGFRGMSARFTVGPRSLQSDLGLILALPAAGKALEAGKEYRFPPREAAAGEGAREGRGGGRFGGERLLMKYQGVEKVDAGDVARFALAPEPREGAGEGPRMETKAEGKADVFLKDGMLLKLEVSSEGKSEGERDGSSFKFSRTSKTTIRRGAAKGGPAAVSV
jgi:hypothetical protein